MIADAVHWLVELIKAMGYPGVFFLSALESTFLPIPSEATLIPAGYLIHQGVWNGPLVFALAVAGTLTGSLVNYYIAFYCGRFVLVKYGKYFFMNETILSHVELYFQKHGPLSVFLGRLVFGIRHFVSFPAGLARMDLKTFCLYTVLGGGLWTFILLLIGYVIGDNQEIIVPLLTGVKGVFAVAVLFVAYIYWKKIKHKDKEQDKITDKS